MDPRKLKEMKKVVDAVLKAGKRFYKTFEGRTYSTGVIGELLVTQGILETYGKDLCSKNDNDIQFKGSCIQNFDIIFNLKGSKFKINAKATTTYNKENAPEWVRQHAKTYMNIEFKKNGTQSCSEKTDCDETLFYVFVDVKKWLDKSKTDFYILSNKEANNPNLTFS